MEGSVQDGWPVMMMALLLLPPLLLLLWLLVAGATAIPVADGPIADTVAASVDPPRFLSDDGAKTMDGRRLRELVDG